MTLARVERKCRDCGRKVGFLADAGRLKTQSLEEIWPGHGPYCQECHNKRWPDSFQRFRDAEIQSGTP